MRKQQDFSDLVDRLNLLEQIALKKYDGHYSIMAFTTNVRICFGTTNTDQMYGNLNMTVEAPTLEEAIKVLLNAEEKYPGENYITILSEETK